MISILIPCYNEEESIDSLIKELCSVAISTNCKFEFVFIDDGSADNTLKIIKKESKKLDKKKILSKLVKLTRNFGKEAAVTAGLKVCTGDAAIIVDSDLQYPLDKIPEFIEKWKEGNKHVVGLRDKKNTSNIVEKAGSNLFNLLINSVGEIEYDSRALDFRLIDRQVIDDYNRLSDQNRMVRNLLDWLGYETTYITYEENERESGESSYSFIKRLNLALNTIIYNSLIPLKAVSVLGFFITLFSGVIGLLAVCRFLFDVGPVFSGPFLLGLLNMFLIGIVLICLGLVAFYIGSIKTEVKGRPLYVIDEIID